MTAIEEAKDFRVAPTSPRRVRRAAPKYLASKIATGFNP
jgi:hypothetical protein